MIKNMKTIAFVSLVYLIIGNIASFAQTKPAAQEGEQIFATVEEMPTYKDGGQEGLVTFLSKELTYPKEAKKQNIQGTVYVSFIVEKDGSVTAVQTMKGVDKLLDDEAVRVAGLTKWTPGKQSGKKVRTRFVLPISFKIEDSKKK
jgi:protein TonB